MEVGVLPLFSGAQMRQTFPFGVTMFFDLGMEPFSTDSLFTVSVIVPNRLPDTRLRTYELKSY